MRSTWVIAKRELAAYFDSLVAYVLIVIFLGLSGFFTWLSNSSNIFLLNQANLQVFFSISFWTLFFFIPAITMRTIAEENRSGTIEMLSTKAITDWQIVMGKFLSCLFLILIALICTLPYYVTVANLGNIDNGAVVGGYLGLILLSMAYIGIGIFASSLTSNQIIAFLLSLFIGLFFHLLFDVIAASLTGSIGETFQFLSARNHYESLSRGVIDSRDIIYFFSVVFLALMYAQVNLSKRNWKN
jgi:ABC-2 type transport system permease protein